MADTLHQHYSTANRSRREGGLRTLGHSKLGDENSPLVTVLTVVFNAEKSLEETIQSVVNQTYRNVEYLVIDGGSTDGTLDVIRKYEHCIDYWISEKDSGIYDAMNKGIDLASGQWLNFMNAGDLFHNKYVLENIKSLFLEDKYLIFGKSLTKYLEFSSLRYSNFDLAKKTFYYSKMPNHQAVFFSRKFYKHEKYDSRFGIAADVQYLQTAFSHNSYRYTDQIISIFYLGGISNFYSSASVAKKNMKAEQAASGRTVLPFVKASLKFFLMKLLGRNRYLVLYIKFLNLRK